MTNVIFCTLRASLEARSHHRMINPRVVQVDRLDLVRDPAASEKLQGGLKELLPPQDLTEVGKASGNVGMGRNAGCLSGDSAAFAMTILEKTKVIKRVLMVRIGDRMLTEGLASRRK